MEKAELGGAARLEGGVGRADVQPEQPQDAEATEGVAPVHQEHEQQFYCYLK